MLFFLTRKGSCCLDAPKRNSNGNADASKGSETTQALSFLLPSSEIHSEVYNTDERARLQAHASEIIASLMKASLFFEDTLRGNAIFFLPGRGRAAWMLRNVTPTAKRTPPRGLRQHKRFCYRLLRFTMRSIILTKEHVCRHVLLR